MTSILSLVKPTERMTLAVFIALPALVSFATIGLAWLDLPQDEVGLKTEVNLEIGNEERKSATRAGMTMKQRLATLDGARSSLEETSAEFDKAKAMRNDLANKLSTLKRHSGSEPDRKALQRTIFKLDRLAANLLENGATLNYEISGLEKAINAPTMSAGDGPSDPRVRIPMKAVSEFDRRRTLGPIEGGHQIRRSRTV